MSVNNKLLMLAILFLILEIAPLCNAFEKDDVETLQNKIIFLNKELNNIDTLINELANQIDKIKENITIYLINDTDEFLINYLEIFFNDNLWYKKDFSIEENNIMKDNPIGIPIKRTFFTKSKDDRLLILKYTYSKKGDKSTSKTLSEEILFTPKTKISTFFSISLIEKKDNRSLDEVDMSFKFW